jgi:hypothetical protein
MRRMANVRSMPQTARFGALPGRGRPSGLAPHVVPFGLACACPGRALRVVVPHVVGIRRRADAATGPSSPDRYPR